MRTVAIVGAGISGLSTAYYLSRAGIPCTLIDRRPKLGGVIMTEVVDGCVIEGGPDSFLAAKPWAMELIRELGLADEVIGSNDHLRVTYVLKRGRLVPLPDGLMMMVPTRILPMATTSLLGWSTKIRMATEWFRKSDGSPKPDRTVSEFIEDHYGREAVDYLAAPLLAGVYGGSPDELSVMSVLPRFAEIEAHYGSLSRGVLNERRKTAAAAQREPLFRTLKGGLGQLVSTLESAAQSTTEIVHGAVEELEKAPGDFRLRVNGDWIVASDVVLACQAYEAAELLAGIDEMLSDLLNRIRYSSSMTVALGYEKRGFAHKLNGFGFLVPKVERRRLIACTWTGTKFSHRVTDERAVLRCFFGGTDDPTILEESDESVVKIARGDLRQIMDVTESPVFQRIHRWPRSMVQYTVGHQQRVEQIEERLGAIPGLHVAGNAYHGIGIPDCVRMGRQAATAISQRS